MKPSEAEAAGLLIPTGPRQWKTPGKDHEAFRVWLDDTGRPRPWRWARVQLRSDDRDYGGARSLRECLWSAAGLRLDEAG